MSECPSYRDVERLLAGAADEPELAGLERHLNDCPHCQTRVAALTGIGTLVPHDPTRVLMRSSSSAALRQAIERLQKEPPVDAAAGTPEGSESNLDFLQPTEEPGFLGRIGNYQVRRVIGRGGMGLVFEALDPLLKRTVAIKMLLPWTLLDAETKGRFLREAQSAAALAHENVVAIYAVEQAQGMLFLVLEFVAGESLEDRLRRSGKLKFDELVSIGAQIARGLAAAHSRGLIHRDIKPANILLCEETGHAKIADFGLAKTAGDVGLTLDGTVVGTPEFMSPEQATNKQPDERSDLFSLGAVLYYAATGRSPFRGETLFLTLDNVRTCQPQPLQQTAPHLPVWFCELVHRLLAKTPEERLGWATAVAETLERSSVPPTLANLPAGQSTVEISTSVNRRITSLKQWWPIGLVALAVLGIAAAWLVNQRTGQSVTSTAVTSPSPPATRSSQPTPLQTGFTIAGRDEAFANLQGAVTTAGDGDIIEVHGNGPFLSPPLSIAGKRLTVRAAPGSHPVLLSETPTVSATQPLITTDADLRLEGLEIHWTLEPRVGVSEIEMLARSIIVCTRGRLLMSHCRIVSDRINGCVGGTCQSMIIHRSHLLAKNGMGIFWRVDPAGRLDIDGCLLENHFAIDVLAGFSFGSTTAGQIRVSRSTLVATQSVQLIVESPIRQPLPVSFNRNLIDAEYLIVFMARLPPRAKAALKLDDQPAVLRSWIAWTEEENVYRRGMDYLARPLAGQKGTLQTASIQNIDQWLELWKLPSARSIEANIRFQSRAASSKTAPLIFEQLEAPSGNVPSNVGALPEQLGPGAAYDAWRKSAEYANWPGL